MEIDADNSLSKKEYLIISSDKKEFVVSGQIRKMAKLFDLNENVRKRSNLVLEGQSTIIIKDKIEVEISSDELSKILNFCAYHKYIPTKEIKKPLLFNDLSKCVEDSWDSNFIMAIEFDKVIDLLNASKILRVNSLIDLCYAYLAIYFRSKKHSHIATPLNVLKHKFFLRETQFSEAELDMIKKENLWLSEYGK